MTQKNKGGRPTNAELAARGVTKTELDSGLRALKKMFGDNISRMIEIAANTDLPLDKQFKMNHDLVKLYMDMLKAQKALQIAELNKDGVQDDTVEPARIEFRLHG